MSTVVLPGSFDPFTLGHLDLARRAAAIAGHVIIAVSHNPSKRSLIGLEERCAAISAAVGQTVGTGAGRTEQAGESQGRIEVRPLPAGLLVDFCRDVGARAVVRGLRGQADLSYEEPMLRMNRHLAGIDTLLLLADPAHAHISSSLVREVAILGGDVADMLPEASREALAGALAEREQQA